MAERGPMSGFPDLLAEEMLPRQALLQTIQEAYAAHGFVPLETPMMERLDTLRGKYGDEGEGLIYTLQDHGGRDLALRYDHTVPLARVVGQHLHRLPMPYKRYAIGPVFRGESPQAGRYRQFTQSDSDIVGTTSPISDAECISLVADTMSALDVDARVRVNNRLILDGLAERAGLTDPAQARSLWGSIDKVDKIGVPAVLAEVKASHGTKAAALTRRYLAITGSADERLAKLGKLLSGSEAAEAGVENLAQIFRMLEGAGYSSDQIVFDQTIARGLNYYTGAVFETTLVGAPELGSVCSGGRYDRLIKDLGGPDLPAVGMSFGVDRLLDGLAKLGKLHDAHTTTEVLVANFSQDLADHYMRIAKALREAGVPTEIYYDADRVKKQFAFANKQGIPQVVVIGPKEIERGIAVIKSMATGVQVEVPLGDIVAMVKEISGQQQVAETA